MSDVACTHAGRSWIIHDPALVPEPSEALFDPAHWRAQNAITGSATGRAAAFFIAGDTHRRPWVLRQYRRGGLPGKLVKDWYLHVPRERTRPFSEFRITQRLHGEGLPVPRPVAAQLERHGLFDRGALITEQIPQVTPLADHLIASDLDADDWTALGRTIAQLHNADVWHADLNARNLLRRADRQWFVIDLDRARALRSRAEIDGNLRRLERSLRKISTAHGTSFDDASDHWRALTTAHAAALS